MWNPLPVHWPSVYFDRFLYGYSVLLCDPLFKLMVASDGLWNPKIGIEINANAYRMIQIYVWLGWITFGLVIDYARMRDKNTDGTDTVADDAKQGTLFS